MLLTVRVYSSEINWSTEGHLPKHTGTKTEPGKANERTRVTDRQTDRMERSREDHVSPSQGICHDSFVVA